ncbi:S-adenosyl-L-methionine-dependent methyltransferase [Xylaria intraflava]|nr:S-adenosyl-L-methionine-dependent methyltransferase [Xylaria intraflava]
MTTPIDAVTLIKSIEQFLAEPSRGLDSLDKDGRHRLSEAARKLSLVTEADGDSVHRILHSPLELPVVMVGVQTRLFEKLVEHGKDGGTSAQLAKETSIDHALIKRILRYYQAFGHVDQPGDDLYCANNITEAMTTLGMRGGAPFYMGSMVPAYNALPGFLRETGYADLADGANSPWFTGHQTKDPPFEWLPKHPELLDGFMGWMSSHHDGLPTIFDEIDFAKEIAQGADPSTPVFVDMGGAMGHQCILLRQKCPSLVGRVILQDLPPVIDQVKSTPLPGFTDIEAQPHDFFKTQPLQGARAYYLRNILHDWPDEKCVEILKQIIPAMDESSKILLDEMVLRDRGTPWRAAELDLSMGATCAAKERSHGQWEELLDKAGLKIERIWKYTEQVDDCVIVAVPK